ncbi:MAG: hypothetical protein AAGA74_02240 [Pseudomonadota bacterium]
MKIRIMQSLDIQGIRNLMKDEEAAHGAMAKPLVFARGDGP